MGRVSCAVAILAAAPLSAQSLPDTSDQALVYPLVTDSRLQNIHGLLVTPAGEVYATKQARRQDGAVYRMGPLGRPMTTVASGLPLSAPGRILFGDGRAPLGNALVLADWNTEYNAPCCDGRVLLGDVIAGTFTTLTSGNPLYAPPGDPYGLALGPGGGFGTDLYVMDFQGASTNPPVLFRIDASGTATTFLVDPVQWPTVTEPTDLAFAPPGAFGGDLFVAERTGAAAVWRVTPTAGLSPFVTAVTRAAAVGFAPAAGGYGSDMFVLAGLGANTGLLRVDASGAPSVLAADLGLWQPGAELAFRDDGKIAYVGVGDTLHMFLPATFGLQASPNPAAPGQILTLRATGGVPGVPALLLIDRFGAFEFYPPEFVIQGTFDASGIYRFQFPVPATFAGMDMRLQILSADSAGDLIASNKAALTFQ